MAAKDRKSISTYNVFKRGIDELNQMKMDLEQMKKELMMTQAKYHQRLSDYEAICEQLRCQGQKVQQAQEEIETDLRNSTEEWNDIKARLQSSVMSPNQKVKLNIGGRYFQTTIETLTRYCEGTTSYFKALFSRQWKLEKDPKDDSIFIDRDGNLFEYILQYLRTGVIPIDIGYDVLRRDLTIEAQFYKMDSLVNLLNQTLSNKLYSNTKILSVDDQIELNKLSGYENQRWQLIYQASRDGYTAKAFHQSCDGCFPTICVIRSKDGFIFGGFISVPWCSTYERKPDESAFLFTLRNPHGIKPTKYPILKQAIEFSFDHNVNKGPTFGSVRYGGEDLSLRSPFHGYANRICFPHNYEDTTKKGRLTFTGDYFFACDDVEIFTLF